MLFSAYPLFFSFFRVYSLLLLLFLFSFFRFSLLPCDLFSRFPFFSEPPFFGAFYRDEKSFLLLLLLSLSFFFTTARSHGVERSFYRKTSKLHFCSLIFNDRVIRFASLSLFILRSVFHINGTSWRKYLYDSRNNESGFKGEKKRREKEN